jgi:hypothetical protein
MKKFKGPAKEQYIFAALFDNHIFHDWAAAYIQSETQDAPSFVEYDCLLPNLELHFPVFGLLSETSD